LRRDAEERDKGEEWRAQGRRVYTRYFVGFFVSVFYLKGYSRPRFIAILPRYGKVSLSVAFSQ
jgi:hypothetical protein